MSESPSTSAMSAKPSSPLRGLLIAQFFGAFNDNAWKLIVALLAIKQAAVSTDLTGLDFEIASQAKTTQAFVIFTLPLMVVSAFAGVFSDRFSKRSVIVAMKILEVFLMAAGTLALFYNPGGGVFPLLVLAAMGAQSALFSPSKYGILPELLPHQRLSWGNGQLEMWTFIAIIAGTALAGPFLDLAGSATWITGIILMLFSGIGLYASLSIPLVQQARTEGGVQETWKAAIYALKHDRFLTLGVLGSIAFWTLASLVGQDVLIYAKAVLGLSDSLSGLPLAGFGVGVGIGSLLAGRASAAKIEFGYVPLGGMGITVCLLAMGLGTPHLGGTCLAMTCLGLASGFVVVPLNALIQWRSPADRRGAVIAFANTLVFGGVLAGSLGSGLLAMIGLSASSIFVFSGLFSISLTISALWVLPEMCIRMIVLTLTHTLYRLTITGRDHIPQEGPALLVPNRISFIDALFLLTSTDRPIRFVINNQYYAHRLLSPLARILQAIPIPSNGSSREILGALHQAGACLDRGELVCVFPEGQITGKGNRVSFRSGFSRIVKGRNVPVIPIHLDRVWASLFSFIGGRFAVKWPNRLPFPITVSIGTPLPSHITAAELRLAVQDLGEAAWHTRKSSRRPLHHSFVWSVRKHPFLAAFGDPTRHWVTRLQALIGAIAIGRALRPHWEGQHTVGIFLPPSIGGALANVAATLSGRTTVNLNYTVGVKGLESAAKQSGLMSVLTSRLFLQKANVELPPHLTPIWIEDIRASIHWQARLTAALLALFAPMRALERYCGAILHPTIDDIATIIFSSGSTGEPKGIMLSHFNIDSNVEGVAQVLQVNHTDRLLGILPFFHSFGYLGTLWFPILHGASVFFYPSPRDAGPIGEMIHQHRLTILLTTPTFLQLYIRRCTPEQFRSLRIILTGAEKLSDRLSAGFRKRFGIQPIEGYGVTECAPVIAVNCPDHLAAGWSQPASRQGTVGQPLPGVTVRIVDPETYQTMPVNTAGMLLVKGPNVMAGYVGREDLTAQVMRQGWYITGDIAKVDEDGFLTITDRLSRFSKIGGEMVPHGLIEHALLQAAQAETTVLAVTAVPDDRKGEQLIVLHTLEESAIPAILEAVSASGLPNLYVPKRDNFLKVDQLPILGSGKLDLQTLKQLALDKLSKIPSGP